MPATLPGLRHYRYVNIAFVLPFADSDGAVPDHSAPSGFLLGGHGRIVLRMTTTATELKPCAGGCGEMVRGTWKRGHKARFDANGSCVAAALLPGPDADDDDLDAWEDLGIVGPPVRAVPELDEADEFDPDEDVPADPPPLHVAASSGQRGKQRQQAAGHGQRRVTVTIKRDIEAKLGMML